MKHSHNPEGFINPNDVHDQPAFDDLKIETASEEGRDHQIRLHFNKAELDGESAELLEQWRIKMRTCLEEWGVEMSKLLDNDKKISPRIREYLEMKGMDLPTFDLYAKDEADKILERFGFGWKKIESRNFLVVFNLPKPLNQFWWKGGAELWGAGSEDLRGMVIEWGRIFRLIIPIVWKAVDDSTPAMERINPCGLHDIEHYYYIWEMAIDPASSYDIFDGHNDRASLGL